MRVDLIDKQPSGAIGAIWEGAKAIAAGFATTLKHLFRKPITEEYPEFKRRLPTRTRARIVLTRDPGGGERCVACYLCSAACPVSCISMQSAEREDGRRFAAWFRINFARCIYCGLCEEACPTSAIQLTPMFETCERPQLFKQILMVAGFERYFQLVKCFRDEDLRADRQPEFTQVDLEMSFVDRRDVIELIEGMMERLFRAVLDVDIATPFEMLSFQESMERFGNDKPDLRFGLELKEMGDLAARGSFKVFLDALSSGGRVKAINGKGMAGMSRKAIDDLPEEAKTFGAKGLAWIKVKNGFESPR